MCQHGHLVIRQVFKGGLDQEVVVGRPRTFCGSGISLSAFIPPWGIFFSIKSAGKRYTELTVGMHKFIIHMPSL